MTQLNFDESTTNTIVSHAAIVRTATDRNGHATDLSIRTTQRWSGVTQSSVSMTLNGADTTYSAVHRASGTNRLTGIVTYSDVRLVRHPSDIARSYPTSGVLYARATNECVARATTRPYHSNVIVYFDGTRTPDAYLDGQRHRLNLQSGLAIPDEGERTHP